MILDLILISTGAMLMRVGFNTEGFIASTVVITVGLILVRLVPMFDSIK